MKDQYGREITYMRVSVTDRCNLRCVYCMPEEGIVSVSHEDILTFDEIVRVCRAACTLGISRIKLTGGEPLVRKGIGRLISMIKNIPGIEQVTMTTNGTLLEGQINELTAAGLDAVNVSIDTLDEKKYEQITRGGKLRDVLRGLSAAADCGVLEVRVNCVPIAGADKDAYIRIAQLAEYNHIDVRFIEMMPIGKGVGYAGYSSDEIYAVLAEKFGEGNVVSERVGNGPAHYVQFDGFRGKIGFISAVSHKFCDQCNRIRLTSEGMLKPCLQYGTGVDLRALLRRKEGAERLEEELKCAIKKAVCMKPAGHCFEKMREDCGKDNKDLETKDMSQIGG